MTTQERPKVVIVGAGFGGVSAAKTLANKPVDVTLIDRRNHHLFQPLLYQVATAALSPADIAAPIRNMMRGARNVTVRLGEVVEVDRNGQAVVLESGERIGYDRLILATGASHSYFGRDEWAAHAPGLKSIEDAFDIRARVLGAFERAEGERYPEIRKALLTFGIVGGGPTGVELAGAIAELARHALTRDFRTITPSCARVLLFEAGPRILPAFDEKLAERAVSQLETLGVSVMTGQRVEQIDGDQVEVGGETIPAKTVLWAAGVQSSPAGAWIGAETDRSGRATVDGSLRTLSDDKVFIVGDCAAHRPENAERPLPGVAPVAKQMGVHAAKILLSEFNLGRDPGAFRYSDYGDMATIGRNRAVARLGRMKLSGFPAWFVWSVAHVAFLTGSRNRLSVAMTWAWSYLTWQRGARIILKTGG